MRLSDAVVTTAEAVDLTRSFFAQARYLVWLAAALNTGNRVALQLQGGQLGVTFTVHASKYLEQWTALGHVKAQSEALFVDPVPVSVRQRFYRVFVNP
jgi:hypothetical protein